MPFCPGCDREIPHRRLDVHVRHCPSLHGGNPVTMAAIEQLDQRLATVEQSLQYRERRVDTELEPPTSKSRSSSDRSTEPDNKS